jgi:hypothetical protein
VVAQGFWVGDVGLVEAARNRFDLLLEGGPLGRVLVAERY